MKTIEQVPIKPEHMEEGDIFIRDENGVMERVVPGKDGQVLKYDPETGQLEFVDYPPPEEHQQ